MPVGVDTAVRLCISALSNKVAIVVGDYDAVIAVEFD